jgi:hypothetical protein
MRTLLDRYRRHVDRASQGQAWPSSRSSHRPALLSARPSTWRVFYADITIENAARAGALQASRTPDSFKKAACDYDDNKIGCATINESRGSFVAIDPGDIDSRCENLAGTVVSCQDEPQPAIRSRVTVSATFDLLTPILAVFFGGQTIDMSATVASDQGPAPSRDRLSRRSRRAAGKRRPAVGRDRDSDLGQRRPRRRAASRQPSRPRPQPELHPGRWRDLVSAGRWRRQSTGP